MPRNPIGAPPGSSVPFGQGGGGGGGGAGDAPSLPRQVNIFLPEERPIPGATEFNPLDFRTSLGAESNIALPNLSLTIPGQCIGVVRGFSIYINDMIPTTVVQWSLRINDMAVPGYNLLQMFPSTLTTSRNGFECMIRVPRGSTLGVVYNNVDGGNHIIGASFSGWFWDERAGQQWVAGSWGV